MNRDILTKGDMPYILSVMDEKYPNLLVEQKAYILATVVHETGVCKPVRELFYLGEPKAERARKRLPYYPYYGRGYVQLTHDYNYRRASEFFGKDFLSYPDLALKREYAVHLLIHGMLKGWYGRSLLGFVNENQVDFLNARRSVNAMDKAEKIADYAKDILGYLTGDESAHKAATEPMKLALVVGHNPVSQGAVRKDLNVSEYVYNSDLAKIIWTKAKDMKNVDVRIFYRDANAGGYSKEIKKVYGEVDDWGATASIEIHFNSAGDPTASGTETISSGSSNSLKLAEEVQMNMVEALDIKDRGVYIRNHRTKGRGYLSLVTGKCPAILIEPFFASNAKDVQAIDETNEKNHLAEAILNGAIEGMERFNET